MVNVYVHDIDAHYRRAESEGAQIVMPLEEMFWGDRRYEALDLERHRWHFAERVTRGPDRRGELPGWGGGGGPPPPPARPNPPEADEDPPHTVDSRNEEAKTL
jgi:hypothetical protein